MDRRAKYRPQAPFKVEPVELTLEDGEKVTTYVREMTLGDRNRLLGRLNDYPHGVLVIRYCECEADGKPAWTDADFPFLEGLRLQQFGKLIEAGIAVNRMAEPESIDEAKNG